MDKNPSTRDGKTVVLRAGESVWTPAAEQYVAAHRTAGV
jgi:hypothetical protein